MSYFEAHVICISNSKALLTDGRNTSVRILTGVCRSRRDPFCEWPILTTIWVMKTLMKTSRKRISVGKSGPTTAPVRSQSKNLTTRQIICAEMVAQTQLCSSFCCVLSRRFPKNCRLEKALQRCAWRDLNCTWKFNNRRKVFIHQGNSQI